MKLSIIIPAFNEEKLLPACLEHVAAAIDANRSEDWSSETIVVDNNSTDRTADIAREAGVCVVFEPINQISRARNAGANVASGDWLLFVDADSFLSANTLADLLACIRAGQHAAGGCIVGLDEIPLYGKPLLWLWNTSSRLMNWAAGSFVFCRADAFRDVGGFSTDLYAAEEIGFSERLKHWAKQHGLKFRLLTAHRHVSSGRKFKLYSTSEIFAHCFRSLFLMPWTIRNRKKLDYFYDGRR